MESRLPGLKAGPSADGKKAGFCLPAVNGGPNTNGEKGRPCLPAANGGPSANGECGPTGGLGAVFGQTIVRLDAAQGPAFMPG